MLSNYGQGLIDPVAWRQFDGEGAEATQYQFMY